MLALEAGRHGAESLRHRGARVTLPRRLLMPVALRPHHTTRETLRLQKRFEGGVVGELIATGCRRSRSD